MLALDEFLGGANIGRVAEVLGLTHSGAVRLVALLEQEGLAERWAGDDRRNVEVRLTDAGRRRAAHARAARDDAVRRTLAGVDPGDAANLERLVSDLVDAGVRARIRDRASGPCRHVVVPDVRLRCLRTTGGAVPRAIGCCLADGLKRRSSRGQERSAVRRGTP